MGNLANFSSQCMPLELLQKKLSAKVFIETGCFRGWSLGYALSIGFDECFSCDIDSEMIEYCNYTLFQYKNKFKIFKNDSITFLDNLLPKLVDTSSIIFYLDAHLPGFDKGQITEITLTDFTFPLEKELEIINNYRANYDDIIICDDLRIYEDGNFENGNWIDRHQFGLSLNFLSKYNYSIQRFYQQEGYFMLSKQ